MSKIYKMIFALVIVIIIIIIFSREKSVNYSNIDYIVKDSGRPGPIIGFVGSIHGNEPAGNYCLRKLAREIEPKCGKYIIIIAANKFGLVNNIRNGPTGDLNRKFNVNTSDLFTAELLALIDQCNLVIDLHEGWGWHKINPRSIGSTLTPSHINHEILLPIVDELNKDLPAEHQFIIRHGDSTLSNCDITSSLGCYREQNGRPYLLIETTGQGDIQPIELRAAQMRLIIMRILAALS